jgi:hypothetical protein
LNEEATAKTLLSAGMRREARLRRIGWDPCFTRGSGKKEASEMKIEVISPLDGTTY